MKNLRLLTLRGFEQIPGALTDMGYTTREMDRWWLVVVREFAVPGYRMAYYCGLYLEDEELPMQPRLSLDWHEDMLLFDYRSAQYFKKNLEEQFPTETWGVVNFRDLARHGDPFSRRAMRPGSVEALSWPWVHPSGATFPCADDDGELG